MNNSPRVRIAPSPTGSLHIGTARTALFNWLFARQHDGVMILRIEDTDRTRSTPEFEQSIIEGLQWLDINWDGEIVRQSERGAQHKQAIQALLDGKSAFYCFHTPKEREIEREQQKTAKKPLVHTCNHFTITPEEQKRRIQSGDSFVIRFRPPAGERVAFNDLIRGTISVSTDEMGDFSIAKSLDDPLYNLAVVVDDHDFAITDVIRGEDHLANTPKQLLLYAALGWSPPRFAHLPLILGTDQLKLSKRHGATAVLEFRDEGYLPEAIVNFLALLGWHPRGDDEKTDVQTMLAEFKLNDVQKGSAIFDRAKLDWLNGRYIRSLELKDLKQHVQPLLDQENIRVDDGINLMEVLRLVRDRMVTLRDIIEGVRLFTEEPTVSADLLAWKKMKHPENETKPMLESAHTLLSNVGEEAWREDHLQRILLDHASDVGGGDRGTFLWPLRAALSGRTHSPGPHEIAAVLGKKRTLQRIQSAMDALS